MRIMVKLLFLLGHEYYSGAQDILYKPTLDESNTFPVAESTESRTILISDSLNNAKPPWTPTKSTIDPTETTLPEPNDLLTTIRPTQTKSAEILTKANISTTNAPTSSTQRITSANITTTPKPPWTSTKATTYPMTESIEDTSITNTPIWPTDPAKTTDNEYITTSTQEPESGEVCYEEKAISKYGDIVIWPETKNNQRVLSEPRCLNDNLQFVSRKCSNSDWIPAHVDDCDAVQQISHYPLQILCPSSYDLIDGLCIMVTNKSPWSDICFSTGNHDSIFTLDDNKKTFDYLVKRGIYDFWVPARRVEEYGYLWILLGKNWKELVRETYIYGIQEGGTCISISISKDGYSMIALDCATELPMVCVQQAKPPSRLTCPESLYTTTYPELQDFCHGFKRIPASTWSETYSHDNATDIFAIRSEQLNQLFQYIMNSTEMSKSCWIALAKNDNNKFHWKDGSLVSYVNWNLTENYVGSFGAFQNGSWSLQSDKKRLDCYLLVRENFVPIPEIVLKFYPNFQRLELIIYWPESLYRSIKSEKDVKCFTDAGAPLAESVPIGDKIWESDWHNFGKNLHSSNATNAHKVIYDIPLKQYPGNYWCEGHLVKTLLLISSEKVFAFKTYYLHIYSLLTEFPVNVLDPSVDYMKYIPENPHVEIYRIQKILRFAESWTLAIVHMILKQPLRVISEAEEIIRSYGIAKEIIQEINANSDIKVTNMNNTLYCIPEEYILQNEYSRSDKIKWNVAKLGQSVTTSELCLREDGLPTYRRCIGDNIFGAAWQGYSETCDSNGTPSQTTETLFELSTTSIDNADHAANVSNEVLELLTKMDALIPADIYYTALILEKVSMVLQVENIYNIKEIISNIISQISRTNATNLEISQLILNSTNVITDSIQRFLEIIPTQEAALENTENGTIIVRSPEFIWQISNPAVRNVSGLALIKRVLSQSGNLDDYNIIPITSRQNLSELLDVDGIEVSTWIPQELLDRIRHTTQNTFKGKGLTVIVAIYNNNSLFQEGRKDFMSGRIISVSIPGYGPNIPIPLPILFRQNYDDKIPINITETCTYWNYNPKKGNIMGDWYKDGCVKTLVHETSDGNLTICSCSHLTNFAQLITGSFKSSAENEERKRHERILNVITVIGCSFSILGVLGIFTFATIFKSWRTNTGAKVILHLSLAIMIQMIIMILFNTDAIQVSLDDSSSFSSKRLSCVITGVLLHYSNIASFCWKIIIAFMQYMRYVRVLGVARPAKFMQRAASIAWGCPLIPVLLILLIDWTIYIPKSQLENAMCYPSGLALYLGVVLPIAIIVLINLVLYSLILKSIFEKPRDSLRRSLDPDLLSSQLRVSIFLFFLLGLNWLFGLIVSMNISVMFDYLFCITATLQGFAMFVYFVVMDPSARKLWKRDMRYCGFKHVLKIAGVK